MTIDEMKRLTIEQKIKLLDIRIDEARQATGREFPKWKDYEGNRQAADKPRYLVQIEKRERELAAICGK